MSLTDRIPTWLEPLRERAQAEEAKQLETRRATLGRQLAELETHQAKAGAAELSELDKLLARERAAKARYDEELAAIATKRRPIRAARASREHQIGRLRGALYEIAPPMVAARAATLRQTAEAVRRERPTVQYREVNTALGVRVETVSEARLLGERAIALDRAAREVEELAYVYLPPAELEQRIAAIVAAVPVLATDGEPAAP